MTTTVRGFKLPSAYGVELPVLRILPSQLLMMRADVHDVEPPDICRCVQRCTPPYAGLSEDLGMSCAITCDVTMGEYPHGQRKQGTVTTVSRRIGMLRPVWVTLRSAVPSHRKQLESRQSSMNKDSINYMGLGMLEGHHDH